jgi:CheY-like chemotaxis protein/anti-sigma regulatory factor (Ser/Thr protein kinase)
VVDIADVVTRAIELSRPVLERRRHNLSLVIARDLYVEGDAERLAQAIGNLLGNAAKYSERGTRTTLTVARHVDTIVISVRDEGIGIAPEMLASVFELFTHGEQAADRVQDGLGLGLAIARNVVELHGGSIRAESEGIGSGALFTIELPATSLPIAEPTLTRTRSSPRTGASRKILVVDDSADIADIMAETLSELGHQVRTANDGPTALEVSAGFLPDVVLLDIGLPEMDGYEVARQLRSQRLEPRPFLIALTGYGQPADQASAEAAGFDAHFVKPIPVDAVLALIDELPGT